MTIRARKPALAVDRDIPRHWFGGSALATHIANGVNLLFPAGERFFVRSVNHYLDQIDDAELRAQVRGFFGQEGRHANAHEQFFDTMRAQGFEIDRFLAWYEKVAYQWLERWSPPALNLAGTAAAEHFTAIMAEGALKEGVLEHAHPAMRELLLWHAAEEIEHKSVAFDVLQRVNPSYALRIAGLALATLNLSGFWLIGTLSLLRQEQVTLGELRAQARAIRQKHDDPIMRRVFARGIREYLRRDFHPSQNDNYELARAYLERAGLETTAAA